jgi:hypothetical protein
VFPPRGVGVVVLEQFFHLVLSLALKFKTTIT